MTHEGLVAALNEATARMTTQLEAHAAKIKELGVEAEIKLSDGHVLRVGRNGKDWGVWVSTSDAYWYWVPPTRAPRHRRALILKEFHALYTAAEAEALRLLNDTRAALGEGEISLP